MRYSKFLINAFATLGVVSFIFLASSFAEDINVDNENSSINNSIGKYQISSFSNPNGQRYMDVINTETGLVKHYWVRRVEDTYVLRTTTNVGD